MTPSFHKLTQDTAGDQSCAYEQREISQVLQRSINLHPCENLEFIGLVFLASSMSFKTETFDTIASLPPTAKLSEISIQIVYPYRPPLVGEHDRDATFLTVARRPEWARLGNSLRNLNALRTVYITFLQSVSDWLVPQDIQLVLSQALSLRSQTEVKICGGDIKPL